MADRQYRFTVILNAEQVLWFYQGQVSSVQVMTDCGKRLQIDLLHFRPFFQHTGLNARFLLTTSLQGKFKRLDKIN